jgi:pimeloyl-ACP methyl ester carboxylesterase
MPAVTVDGTQLEYVERGSGEPLVFVHGSLGDLRSWEPQLESFAERHRVIAYSRRYHHPNSCRGDAASYSAALHADDLAELMAALGLGSAHLVGSSYGGYTALYLAARHPDLVRTQVLSEPPVLPLLDDDPEGRAVRDDFLDSVWGPAGDLLARGQTEAGLRTFVDGLFGEGTFDELPAAVRELIMDNVCEFGLETSSPDFWTAFTCEDSRRVTTPTLLLSGGSSIRMFQLVVEQLARCLPNSEHVRIPDSGHDLPTEDVDAYREVALDFLGAHGEP